ncbi:prostamide/prostaglandin F synthase-like [Artemia franciscana]|uniref:prostamide/prostaglandin F synthase-like n=1 Tax=Artemia franciscana TaxID=6661 RepID=UPI0032DB782D
MITALFAKVARDAMSKTRALGISGDMKGDGFQNGGVLIVEKGGKLLYYYKQDNPADHVANEKILEVLGIDNTNSVPAQKSDESSAAECTDACSFDGKK